jgi:hypothetical protein
MNPRTRWLLTAACLWLVLALVPPAGTCGQDSGLAAFRGVTVPPVGREEATQLIEAGTVETDGYRDVVLSIAGEMKEDRTEGGVVGAILIPEGRVFEYLRRNERVYAFPLEVTARLEADGPAVFLGKQVVARVAFPRYRVLLYNTTDRTASVSVFVYRSH